MRFYVKCRNCNDKHYLYGKLELMRKKGVENMGVQMGDKEETYKLSEVRAESEWRFHLLAIVGFFLTALVGVPFNIVIAITLIIVAIGLPFDLSDREKVKKWNSGKI